MPTQGDESTPPDGSIVRMTWTNGRTGLRWALLGALLLTGLSAPAEAATGRHPLFNDGGTLPWGTSWKDAGQVALAKKRAVLVVLSHDTCGLCKEFVEQVVAAPALRARSSRAFVGCHVDAKQPDKQLHAALVKKLPGGRYLPFVGVLNTKGQWLGGFVADAQSTKVSLHAEYLKVLGAAESALGIPPPRVEPRPEAPPVAPTPRTPPQPVAPPKPDTTINGLAVYRNWNDAREAAHRTGKMIWVLTTKPKCSSCDKMKQERLPEVAASIAPHAVMYYYDIFHPQSKAVDSLLRKMLPKNQHMMPLWGFITPDVRWLSGNSGAPAAAKIRSLYQEALSNHRRLSRGR